MRILNTVFSDVHPQPLKFSPLALHELHMNLTAAILFKKENEYSVKLTTELHTTVLGGRGARLRSRA